MGMQKHREITHLGSVQLNGTKRIQATGLLVTENVSFYRVILKVGVSALPRGYLETSGGVFVCPELREGAPAL